jgi:hypothetical protein
MTDDKILEALNAIKADTGVLKVEQAETNRRLHQIETRLELHTEMMLAITQRLRALEVA